jgi:hypothetical protein
MLMLTNSKAKYALDLLVRSGETAERWLARAGLFDSVNLNNTIAKNAIVDDCALDVAGTSSMRAMSSMRAAILRDA